MVIGGMLGASFWLLFHNIFMGMPSEPAPFIIIGMMAMFGGIAHAPLAVMLMVAEMTGNLSLLAPAMVAVAISTALTGNNTIYRSQVLDRASSPVHRLRFSFPLLSSLLVRDAVIYCDHFEASKLTCEDAIGYFNRNSTSVLVIVDREGQYAGVVRRKQVESISPELRSSTTLESLVDEKALALDSNEHLDIALEKLTHGGMSWAPVVEDGQVIGKLTVKDSIATYRNTLERSVRRTNSLPGNTALLEARLSDTSPLVGKTLRDAKFPADTLLVSIARQGETIFPSASTQLEAGDLVVIMADPASEDILREFLGDILADEKNSKSVEKS